RTVDPNERTVRCGTVGDNTGEDEEIPVEQTQIAQKADQRVSPADSAFRAYIDNQDRYNIKRNIPVRETGTIEEQTFFTPVKGIATQHFDAQARHYGIDIACKKDEGIKAALDGMVIFSGFT